MHHGPHEEDGKVADELFGATSPLISGAYHVSYNFLALALGMDATYIHGHGIGTSARTSDTSAGANANNARTKETNVGTNEPNA